MCFCTSAKPWKPEGPRKAPTLLAAEGLHKLRVLMHACGILKGADGLGQVQVGNFMVSYTVIAAWQAQVGEGCGLLLQSRCGQMFWQACLWLAAPNLSRLHRSLLQLRFPQDTGPPCWEAP